jgi:NTP pyrophosphatase (non-canonical NTP hydrolase)
METTYTLKQSIQRHQDLVKFTQLRDGNLPTQEFRLLNAVLGLCGESGELGEVVAGLLTNGATRDTVIKEIGDVYWYCQQLGMAIMEPDHSLSFITNIIEECVNEWDFGTFSLMDHISVLSFNCGMLADILKKNVSHGAPFDLIKAVDKFEDIVYLITLVAEKYGKGCIQEALEGNITKLMKRYPNGFSTEASIARVDVEK